MKKIFTLFFAMCLLTACVPPVGAVSFDLSGLADDYEIGEAKQLLKFDGTDTVTLDGGTGTTSTAADGVLTATKTDPGAEGEIDIRHKTILSDYAETRYLFSFKFKLNYETSVLLSSGHTQMATNEVMRTSFAADGNTVSSYTDSTYNTSVTAKVGKPSEDGWMKLDFLFDNVNRKYYLWVNETGDLLTKAPVIDACSYYDDRSDKKQQSFRLWTGGIPAGDTAELCVKEMTVSPLHRKASRALSYLNQVKNMIYEENFDSYEASAYKDNAGAEPWKTWLDKEVIGTGTSGNGGYNPQDLSIAPDGADDNRLEICSSAKNYHNFIFTKLPGTSLPAYSAANTDVNTVVQLKIKADNEVWLLLGSGAASKANIALVATADGMTVKNNEKRASSTSTFAIKDDFENADYATVTFLLHDNDGADNDTYSLWIGDEPVARNEKFAGTTKDYTKIDRLNFYCAAANTHVWIDDIRVYELADTDFLKVYSFMRSLGDSDSVTKLGEDGLLSGFKSAAELGATDVDVQYVDSAGCLNGADIKFPLFANAGVKVRAIVSCNGYKEQKTFDSAVTFPSGYKAKGEAVKSGSKASIPVTLRSDSSARAEEVFAVAAAYDGGSLVKTCICTFNESTKAYEADFGVDLAGYAVRGFIWQNGTLKPVV